MLDVYENENWTAYKTGWNKSNITHSYTLIKLKAVKQHV